jgi:hypothetical protein
MMTVVRSLCCKNTTCPQVLPGRKFFDGYHRSNATIWYDWSMSDLPLFILLQLFTLATSYFLVVFCLRVFKGLNPVVKAVLTITLLGLLQMCILFAFMALLGPWGLLRH